MCTVLLVTWLMPVTSYVQGSHLDWKTWKMKKTSTSQGKLKFGQGQGKSWNFLRGEGNVRELFEDI